MTAITQISLEKGLVLTMDLCNRRNLWIVFRLQTVSVVSQKPWVHLPRGRGRWCPYVYENTSLLYVF